MSPKASNSSRHTDDKQKMDMQVHFKEGNELGERMSDNQLFREGVF